MPARAEDNPSLDLAAYELSLSQLGPVRYQQLRWGRWIRDAGGLVYPVMADNVIDAAPACTRFVLAIDYGFNDSTAFVIWGWREHDPAAYCLYAQKFTGLIPSAAAEHARKLEQTWKFEAIVGDTGGLGKGYAEEARTRFHLPIQPAEKHNKRGYIDLFVGDMTRKRILFVREACAEYLLEAKKLPWGKERKEPAPGFEDHLCDAGLYGWRRARAHYETEKIDGPPPNTREAWKLEAEKQKAAYLASMKARRRPK